MKLYLVIEPILQKNMTEVPESDLYIKYYLPEQSQESHKGPWLI